MSARDRSLTDRARQLEAGRAMCRSPVEEPKREWLTFHCTNCGYKIRYVPTERWRGRLRCPECGEIFDVPIEGDEESKVPTLDDFTKQTEPPKKARRNRSSQSSPRDAQLQYETLRTHKKNIIVPKI